MNAYIEDSQIRDYHDIIRGLKEENEALNKRINHQCEQLKEAEKYVHILHQIKKVIHRPLFKIMQVESELYRELINPWQKLQDQFKEIEEIIEGF